MRLYLRFRPNEDIDAWTYIFVHAGLNPWMITPSGPGGSMDRQQIC